jgi:hypothetical protein
VSFSGGTVCFDCSARSDHSCYAPYQATIDQLSAQKEGYFNRLIHAVSLKILIILNLRGRGTLSLH